MAGHKSAPTDNLTLHVDSVHDRAFHTFLDEHGVCPETMKLFRSILYEYYDSFGRHDLPWRKTQDPYEIYISEVMLQQTQVPRVAVLYPKFLERFPDVTTLAAAPLKDVIAAWQGMGYNRRARYLRESAIIVSQNYKGQIPNDEAKLQALSGIGPATASSIRAFGFNAPVVFIETNIRRVFIHFFFQGDDEVHDRDIFPLVQAALDLENPRRFYSALMDYGTMLAKTVANPNCKSTLYTRQSPFEGSDRQIRGQILNVLLSEGSLSMKNLITQISGDPARVRNILGTLEDEGFLIRKGKIVRLAE